MTKILIECIRVTLSKFLTNIIIGVVSGSHSKLKRCNGRRVTG